jgi:D-arginine dehydrogenase
MQTLEYDVVVIGAGIAGASAAAHLAADHRVALVEAEEAAGYHTTGRSAAIWILNYGPPDVRVLTAESRGFFEAPPAGFAEVPLMSRRPLVLLGRPGQEQMVSDAIASGSGLRAIAPERLRELVPALRLENTAAAAVENDSFDMDVATLHQAFLRQLQRRGGVLALRSRAGPIRRADGVWNVSVTDGSIFRGRIVVNAAGAWGDEVAAAAGVKPIGLTPKRRTGAIIDPAPWQVADWPMLCAIDDSWYCRPEARTRMMVSPADETPMAAHDVRPDELDIAIGIDRMQQSLAVDVHRVERSWAGLRTFTPDGSLAIGWDASAAGFFWCCGQGGYGIQTSPAAGRFVADLIGERDLGLAETIRARVAPSRFHGALASV